MNITVILCTYNRSQSLATALDSLAASIVPEGIEWEILVVDNNSKDNTRSVVEDFCQKHPGRFRYLFEPRQGKSNALNSGIRESHGDILAFVDDDVIVEPVWLHNLTSALNDGEWAGSGGRILPARTFAAPRWMALEGPLSLIGALCAYCNPGDTPGELKEAPFGANMAYRKEMFARYGGFRTDLGPRPGSDLRSEDTEFGHRLMAGGDRIRYVPSATVYHEIHEGRVRKGFFLAWWYEFGRGLVREKNLTTFQAFKIFCRAILTTAQWLLSLDPQRRFYSKCRTWFAAGKLIEAYRQARVSGCEIKRQPESI